MGEHYAYCRDLVCLGCLPTMDDLRARAEDGTRGALDIGGKLLKRAIPMPSGGLGQPAHTQAMLAALAHQEEWYLTVSRLCRYELVVGHPMTPWPKVPARG